MARLGRRAHNRSSGRGPAGRLGQDARQGGLPGRASSARGGAAHAGGRRASGGPEGKRLNHVDQGGTGAAGRNKDLAQVARGGTLNLAGAVISAIATLGVTLVLTRQFSKPVAGAFFAATSLFLIIETVANLGAYNGAVYFIARLRSLGQLSRIPVVMRAAIFPVVVAATIAAVAMLLLAGPLAHLLLGGHLGHGGASPRAVASALRALAVAVPFAALLDTFLGASRGFRDMRPTVLVDRVGRSTGQLVGVLVATAAGSAALLAPLWAASYIPACAVAWLWLRRIRRRRASADKPRTPIPPELASVPPALAALLAMSVPEPTANVGPPAPTHSGRRSPAPVSARVFWRFTAPRALATVAQVTIQRLDIVLVGILRGPAEAAIYTAATRFLVAGQLGNAAISQAAQPRFTELFALGDRAGAKSIYQVTTGWLVLLTWPLYLLAMVFSSQFLALFGHSYHVGSTVMLILGSAMLVATACGQVDMVLTTTGRSSWSLANGLLAVGINVSVDLALIPRYGITGAAIGWAAAIGITNLLPLAQVAGVVRIHPFGRGMLAACGLTTLSFCAIPLALRVLAGDGPVTVLAAIGAGCVVQALGLWLLADPLRLSVMPGLAFLRGRTHSRAAARPPQDAAASTRAAP